MVKHTTQFVVTLTVMLVKIVIAVQVTAEHAHLYVEMAAATETKQLLRALRTVQ